MTCSSSNYDLDRADRARHASVAPAGTGTNQTAEPLFVNAAAADFHQAAGSPTIDAGPADATPATTDVDGRLAASRARRSTSAPTSSVAAAPPPADTTPPETTIDKGPKKKTKSKKATFTFSSSEAGSTFTCTVDKKPATPCTSPLKLKRLKKGKHKLTVFATDAAGNADATPADYKWKVKKKPKR